MHKFTYLAKLLTGIHLIHLKNAHSFPLLRPNDAILDGFLIKNNFLTRFLVRALRIFYYKAMRPKEITISRDSLGIYRSKSTVGHGVRYQTDPQMHYRAIRINLFILSSGKNTFDC